MANIYGLISGVSKYGTGSFYTPFNTTESKALRIQPQIGTTFSIASGEDFYFSAWIKYGTNNVSTLNARYPIIRFGRQTTGTKSGWELGLVINQIGDGYNALPYFGYDGNTIRTTWNGSNGNTVSPSSGFDHWEVYRSGSTLTLRFTNTSGIANITSVTYSGAIAANTASLYTNAIFVGSQQPFVVNQDNGAYIDELYFAKGVSAPQNIKALTGEINDGAEPTTVFLLHLNGNLADEITEDSSAELLSKFTLRSTLTFVTGPEKRWISEVSSTDSNYYFPSAGGVAITKDLSTYVLGTRSELADPTSTFNNDPYIIKYNNLGQVEWSKIIDLEYPALSIYGGLKTDSQGNVFGSLAVYENPTGSESFGLTDIIVFKVSSAGALLWTRGLGVTARQDFPYDLVVDNDGNVIIAGIQRIVGRSGMFLHKLSSTGSPSVYLWRKEIAMPGTGAGYANELATDTDNNIYVLGYNNEKPWLAKFNPSGAFLWQQDININLPTGSSSTSLTIAGLEHGIATDGTGNVYVGFSVWNTVALETAGLIGKFDTDGNLQWAKISGFSSSTTNDYAISAVTTDYNDNVVITSRAGYILKLNPSGSIIYENKLAKTSATTITEDIVLSQTNEVIISGDCGDKLTVWKLAAEGNRVGTFENNWSITPSTDIQFTPTTWTTTTTSLASSVSLAQTNKSYPGSMVDITQYSQVFTDLSLQNLGTLNLTAGFTSTQAIIKVNRARAVLSSTVTSIIRPGVLRKTSASVTSQFVSTINATKVHRTGTALQTTATVQAQVKQFKGTRVPLSAATSMSISAVKTSRARSNLTAFVVQVTIDIGTKRGTAALTSQFAVTATNSRLRDNQVSAQATITQATQAEKLVRTAVALASQTASVINNSRLRDLSADLQVQAFELSINRKITSTQANLTSTFALDANVYILQYSLTNVASTFTAQINAIATKQFASVIISPSQLLVNGGYVRGASANLQVQAFELTTGSKFTLEPRLQLYIDQETRIYLVKPEDTQLAIYSDGILKIKPETRLLPLKASDPVNTIPGIKL